MAAWFRQNPILRVRFAGWESDTYTLMRHGWEMAFSEDLGSGNMRVSLRHKEMGLGAMGEIGDYWRYAMQARDEYSRDKLPVIQLHIMGRQENVFIHGQMAAYNNFKQVSMDPTDTMLSMQTFKMSEIPWFQEVGKSVAQELIIEPDDVQAVLDGILKAQAPGMRDIRARDRKRENEVTQVHAQIVTLKAA